MIVNTTARQRGFGRWLKKWEDLVPQQRLTRFDISGRFAEPALKAPPP